MSPTDHDPERQGPTSYPARCDDHRKSRPLILLLFLFFLALPAEANEAEKKATVRAAHEALFKGSRVDDLGITGPVPVDHPGRRYPATHDFPTGPDISERLPDFTLPNHNGEAVDYHADRGDSKSVVVFFRSAVW